MPTPKRHAVVLQMLREMILRGELAAGERVTEAALSERLGISRTPVRQSLPMLAKEGLLTAAGARGFAVRSFTAAECLKAIRLRAALEGLAARQIAERGPAPELVDALRACLAEGDAVVAGPAGAGDAPYSAMNGRFHDALVRGADDPLLLEMVERCNLVPFVAPSAVAFERAGPAEAHRILAYAHRQHHAILDALLSRDGTRCEFLMREHAVAQERNLHL